MKAIRGDNPRTTNQRVYLMPVVPPRPRKGPLTPDVEQFSFSFPRSPHAPRSARRSFSIRLHVYLSPSRSLSFSRSLAPSFVAPLRRSAPPLSPPPPPPRSRVIVSLLSDMSLCYRHNQPPFPSSLLIPRPHRASRPVLPSPLTPRAATAAAVCYLQRVARSRTPAI